MIQIGDACPHFTLSDQKGNPFNLDEVLGKKILVIYFYPKDDTPGCTKEACSFRDQYTAFQDLGCEVVGISSDSVKDHIKFAEKYQLPFILLSDENKTVRKSFGVPGSLFGLIPGRVTYVIDLKGQVAGIFNSQIQAHKHIEEALKVVRGL